MKRLAAGLAVFIMAAVVLFAQSDYQVLALVKLNKNEPVMLKDLKSRVEIYIGFNRERKQKNGENRDPGPARDMRQT